VVTPTNKEIMKRTLIVLFVLSILMISSCVSPDEYIKTQSSLRVVYINGDIDTIKVNYSSKSGGEAKFYLRQDGSSVFSKSQVPQPSIVVDQLPLAPPHIVAINVRSFEVLYTTNIKEVNLEVDPLSWIKK